MTKIDIISGFLGAGKTTFIKKMIDEAFTGEKIVLIENEFGEVGIDGGFLKDAGIQITEMQICVTAKLWLYHKPAWTCTCHPFAFLYSIRGLLLGLMNPSQFKCRIRTLSRSCENMPTNFFCFFIYTKLRKQSYNAKADQVYGNCHNK